MFCNKNRKRSDRFTFINNEQGPDEFCQWEQYYTLLDKLKIHCVKEHILSFITGVNGTINTQITIQKKAYEKRMLDDSMVFNCQTWSWENIK